MIGLTELEAQQFVQFQKHRAFIGLLDSLKVFDIRDGSVTIHFNSLGEIKTVDKHIYYRT